jgi:hypothetical protein
MAGNYQYDEAQIRNAISALEQHVAGMRTSAGEVEQTAEYITMTYVAHSSTMFQRKIHDWLDEYNRVARAFDRLGQNSSTVSGVISRAEEDAHTSALTLNIESSLNVGA